MQTGANSSIEARILHHSNSYAYIVLLFAVKYKFNDVMVEYFNSSALSGLLHSIKHLLNIYITFPRWGVRSCLEPRV